ncbi:hypothetical protein ABVT39_019039 [Epinephelus coioides]
MELSEAEQHPQLCSAPYIRPRNRQPGGGAVRPGAAARCALVRSGDSARTQRRRGGSRASRGAFIAGMNKRPQNVSTRDDLVKRKLCCECKQ